MVETNKISFDMPHVECFDPLADNSYGKFVVEPLERGYGTTLGNSLRRVLLSSLPGYAATSIKIAGVQHEFSTIPGVKEDVTEIVLNVKSIIAKLYCEGPKTLYLEASGEGVVTAGDIKADAQEINEKRREEERLKEIEDAKAVIAEAEEKIAELEADEAEGAAVAGA